MSIENRPGFTGLLSLHLEHRLEAAGKAGLDVKEASARRIDGLRGEVSVSAVNQALARMSRAGLAVEQDGKWYTPKAKNLVAGTVELIDDCNAGVRTSRGRLFDLPTRDRGQALPGDRVLVRQRPGKKGRAGNPAAFVIQVIERKRETMVGTLEQDDDGRWLVPFDSKVPFDVEVVGGDDLAEDQYAVVRLDETSAGPDSPVRAHVVEVIGSVDQPGIDIDVALRHYQIPEDFSPEALAQVTGLADDPSAEDRVGRLDLTDQLAITIDGATAKDFDDALSIERRGDGFRAGVHIADVGHWVAEGSALDQEAYERGTSVYFPGRAVPMLPEVLSNGLCSLKPDVPRLTLSVLLDFDAEGRVVGRQFAETVIRSRRRMTYDEAHNWIENGPPEEAGSRASEIGEVLLAMRDLMRLLHAARQERGSLDFDLPSGDIVLDTDGRTVGIQPSERHQAHRIVEELMIAANEAVAAYLVETATPALYRVLEAPDPTSVDDLATALGVLGVEFHGDPEHLHPGELQDVLERVGGRPDEPFVSSLVLRTMKRASYDPECLGHYALATRFYTHFTSPIRRYPDLVVHRQLRSSIRRQGEERVASGGEDRSLLAERLPEIAGQTSTLERRAESCERDVLQWKKVRFLADRVGETFPGRITGVQPFGLFVQLDEFAVDGLVPIKVLGEEYFRFEPEAHRLVGSETDAEFRLGDPIEVKLVAVSQRHRGLDLRPVSPSTPERGKGSGADRGQGRGRGRGRGRSRSSTGRSDSKGRRSKGRPSNGGGSRRR